MWPSSCATTRSVIEPSIQLSSPGNSPRPAQLQPVVFGNAYTFVTDVGYVPGDLGMIRQVTGARMLDALGRLHPRPPVLRDQLLRALDLDDASLTENTRAAYSIEQIANAGKGSLDPQTAATLEKNLMVVDQAIGESRAALRQHPTSEPAQQSLLDSFKTKLAVIDQAINEITTARGTIGNFSRNVLESNIRSLNSAKENLKIIQLFDLLERSEEYEETIVLKKIESQLNILIKNMVGQAVSFRARLNQSTQITINI